MLPDSLPPENNFEIMSVGTAAQFSRADLKEIAIVDL